MNFNFPSRFLKKLDIYQQIRSGQGISKHKRLWKYEAQFLKTAYGKDHQHLNSRINIENFIKWIGYSDCCVKEYEEILGNLFFRGYVDIIDMGNSKVILQKSHKAFDNKELAQGVENGEKQRIPNEVRPTMDGLLVGEVLSEIENKEVILMLWNKYRYAIVVDIFWLLIFLGLAKLFFSEKLVEILNIIKAANVHINNFYIGYNLRIAFLIFVFWPFLNFVYRKIYSVMEK